MQIWQSGHKEGTEQCEHYQPNDYVAFQGREDQLSNFYPCSMVWQKTDMLPSEMAYGYETSVAHARPDNKSDILKTSEAGAVKTLMKRIDKNED